MYNKSNGIFFNCKELSFRKYLKNTEGNMIIINSQTDL